MGEGGDRTPASLLQLSPGKHSLLGAHGGFFALAWVQRPGAETKPQMETEQ